MKFSTTIVAGFVACGLAFQADAIQVTKVNGIESRDGATFFIPAATGLQLAGTYGAGEDPMVYSNIQVKENPPTSHQTCVGVGASWGKSTWTYQAGQPLNSQIAWDGTDKIVTVVADNCALAFPSITGVGVNPPALGFSTASTFTAKKFIPESITITPTLTGTQTVRVSITLSNEDEGKPNDFYIVALLPKGVLGLIADTVVSCTAVDAAGCSKWVAGVIAIKTITGTTTQTIATQIDLSSLKGVTLYAGYAWGGASPDKIGQGRVWKYISQKIQ